MSQTFQINVTAAAPTATVVTSALLGMTTAQLTAFAASLFNALSPASLAATFAAIVVPCDTAAAASQASATAAAASAAAATTTAAGISASTLATQIAALPQAQRVLLAQALIQSLAVDPGGAVPVAAGNAFITDSGYIGMAQ